MKAKQEPSIRRRILTPIVFSGILAYLPCFALQAFGQLPSSSSPPASPSAADRKPLPDSRLGIRTAPILLLTRPDVQAELKLTAEQIDEAEKEISRLYSEAAALKGKSESEAVTLRRAIDELEFRWIQQNLEDIQRERLAQVELWWEGTSALISRPWLAEKLGLTETQRKELEKAVVERDQDRKKRGFDIEAEKKLRKVGLALLTPDQKERLHAVLGAPFDPLINLPK